MKRNYKINVGLKPQISGLEEENNCSFIIMFCLLIGPALTVVIIESHHHNM